ncbi:MAG: hypothetical protein Q8Q09_05775 [Deltaproteobacteria bacterium]|nr:hypothetical protein [Deltaproteobacteria bacterium]
MKTHGEPRQTKRPPRALAIAALSLLTCTCGPSLRTDGPPVYVGHIEGSDALIAIVADEGTLVAYTCGGTRSWETHTGWFHPVLPVDGLSGATQTIPVTRSARGLQLTGSIEPTSASGTLQLSDGATVPWRAQRADPSRGAGFFTISDGGELSGLIVANDGAVAGVRVGIGADDTRTPTPIAATPPSNSGTAVTGRVTIGTQSGVPISLQPTVQGRLVQVQRAAPTIVVLLHGVTSVGDQAKLENGRLTLDDDLTEVQRVRNTPVIKPHPGTRMHARSYWTAPFVSGLLTGRPDNALFTLGSGTNITGPAFLHADTAADITATVATAAPPPGDCDLNDLIVNQVPSTAVPVAGLPPQAPRLSLLLGHRDGKLPLMVQVMNATDQVYRCVDLFRTRYRVEPALVFVGHSGGGLVIRGILSNPSRASLVAAGAIDSATPNHLHYDRANIDGDPLSTRQKMSFLRDRAMYAVTLATPHQGSPFADFAARARPEVERVRQWLIAGAGADFGRFNVPPVLATSVQALGSAGVILSPQAPINGVLESAESTTRRASAELLAVIDGFVKPAYDDNPITIELASARWRAFNRGALHPQAARRGPSSPIPGAAGALVPIYTAGARAAGSDVLDSMDVSEIARGMTAISTRSMPRRSRFWLMGLTFVDQLMRGYGGIPMAPRPLASQLDRVNATGWFAEGTAMYARRSPVLDATFRAVYGLSGARDVDNLLRWLSNETGTRLNQASFVAPVYLSRTWEVLDRPTTFPVPALRCTANDGVVLELAFDYTPMITALVSSFGTMDAALRALANQDFSALMTRFENTGGALANVVPNLRADFDTLFRAATRPECVDPGRWRLATAMRTIALPLPTETTNTASDGLVDHDGFVLYESAHGVTLGRDGTDGMPLTLEFFDHTRLDDTSTGTPTPGSWYRRYTSALEPFNHEIQRFETGQWVFTNLLARSPGPLPAIAGELSVFASP